jgi:hypothetical protein
VFRISGEQYSSGQSSWTEKSAVIRAMLRVLKEPAYADVRIAFGRSGLLGVMGDTTVARIVLDTADLLDDETRGLAARLLDRGDAPGQSAPPAGRLSQYGPDYLRPRVADLVRRWKATAARVVIYGAGEHTANLFKWTDLNQANVVGLVDSNPSLAGEVYWSLPVSGPGQLASLAPDAIVISSMFAEDQMYLAARALVGADVEVVRLYEERDAESASSCARASEP